MPYRTRCTFYLMSAGHVCLLAGGCALRIKAVVTVSALDECDSGEVAATTSEEGACRSERHGHEPP